MRDHDQKEEGQQLAGNQQRMMLGLTFAPILKQQQYQQIAVFGHGEFVTLQRQIMKRLRSDKTLTHSLSEYHSSIQIATFTISGSMAHSFLIGYLTMVMNILSRLIALLTKGTSKP